MSALKWKKEILRFESQFFVLILSSKKQYMLLQWLERMKNALPEYLFKVKKVTRAKNMNSVRFWIRLSGCI